MSNKISLVTDLIQDVFESHEVNVMEALVILEFMKHNLLDNMIQEMNEDLDELE